MGKLGAEAMERWVPPAQWDSYFTLTRGCLLHARPCIGCWDSEMIDPGLLKEPTAQYRG